MRAASGQNEETSMKNIILAAALLSAMSSYAMAQTTTTTVTKTPAVATSGTKNANAPVEGKNSFTQAQGRIADAGFTNVSGLQLDDKGI